MTCTCRTVNGTTTTGFRLIQYLACHTQINAGVFDFEYFINPYEYWYGSYTIFRNAGGRAYHMESLVSMEPILT